MKKIMFILLTGLLFVFIACEKDEIQEVDSAELNVEQLMMLDSSNPDYIPGGITKKVTQKLNLTPKVNFRNGDGECTLLPDECFAEAHRGDIIGETKHAKLWLPQSADIMFFFDLSGSMGQEVNKFDDNVSIILNEIIEPGFSPFFGISGGCDAYDYVYQNHCPLTQDQAAFEAAIPPSTIGGSREQYGEQFRLLAETINWNTEGFPKYVIAFLDENVDAAYPIIITSVADGVSALNAKGITLIIIFSGENQVLLDEWDVFAESTGGDAFPIAANAEIPGGMAALIDLIIEGQLLDINEITLHIPDAYYSGWMYSCIPDKYPNASDPLPLVIPTPDPGYLFNLEFKVPVNADIAVHTFDIILLGDGQTYASQKVSIEVLIDDTDNDGCIDEEDPHPYSIKDQYVTIDGCETGVLNVFVTQCSTMMDLLQECAEDAVNHGDYVSCVAALTNDWKAAGFITGKEKGKIQSCAAQTDIPLNSI
jgi:hypothetical protein